MAVLKKVVVSSLVSNSSMSPRQLFSDFSSSHTYALANVKVENVAQQNKLQMFRYKMQNVFEEGKIRLHALLILLIFLFCHE